MSKPKASFYEIFNKSEDTKTVDILIYGAIPELDWDTYELKNTAEKFVKDFKGLEKDYDRINIHINSPGGSLYHAFPIYNVIANSTKEVHTYNDGLAASAGGVLLLAGKTIHSAKNAFLMIHNASGACFGPATKMRDVADMLEKYEGVIAQRFAEKSGMTVADFTAKYFNNKDHFLTAEDALEAKFIDIIEDYESEDAPPSNIQNMAFSEVMNLYKKEEKSLSFFDKLTNHLRNAFPAPTLEQKKDAPTPTPTHQNTDMNFENSLSILNKETVTAEDIAAVKAEIQAYNQAGEKLTAEEVTAKVEEATKPLQTEISNLVTEKTNAENLAASLTQEKAALETEKTTLDAENKGLKLTVEAYRKSGVKVDNTSSDTPDPIQGEDGVDNFLSEADVEAKRIRAEAGFATK